jgi:16S rRNA A1518/A1519 N6-dimethyltransferase RsmA/KsgA/DIM1 with predicted DNA glycosylase/AP lyase activity
MGKPRVKTLNAFMKSKDWEEVYYYIKDIKMAQIVLKHLSNDLPNEKSIIFESSPGNGVLTRLLLSSGAPLVRVFEDNSNHLNKLMVRFIKNFNQIIDK